MNMHTNKRYIQEQQLQTQPSGKLYKGHDSILHRDVMLYISEMNVNEGPRLDVIQSIKDGSQLPEDRFMHVWDIHVDVQSITIVLKPELGYFLDQELEIHSLSLYEILILTRKIGQSMQDAARDGVAGFSIHPNNIWMQGTNQPIIINYWNHDDQHWSGTGGLGRLLYQLIVRARLLPIDVDAMCSLLADALGEMPDDQKEAITRWMRAALQYAISLSLLLHGLDQILLAYPQHGDIAHTISVQKPIPPVEEFAVNSGQQLPQQPFPSRLFPRQPDNQLQSNPHKSQKAAADPKAAKRSGTKKQWMIAALIIIMLLLALTVHLLRKPQPTNQQELFETKPVFQHPAVPPSTPAPAPATPKPAGAADIVVVPNLQNMPLKEAEALLLSNGLRYQYFLEASESAAGKVLRQEPAANQKVEKGAVITFYAGK